MKKKWIALGVLFLLVVIIIIIKIFLLPGNNNINPSSDNTLEETVIIRADNFEISYNKVSYVISYPLEQSISRIIKIKNLESDPIELDARSYVTINGKDEELPGWPQPFPSKFEPLEEKEIIFKYEFNGGIFISPVIGQIYDYPFSIRLSLKNSTDSTTSFVLNNQVNYLGDERSPININTGSIISGRVYSGDSSTPVSNARVRVTTDLPIPPLDTTTDSSGSFSADVIAYQRKFLGNWIQYSISVEKEGYETYNIALSPKENEELKIDVHMIAQTERADYELVFKYDTGLPTARVVFSKNSDYFVTVPFHSSESVSFIKERAYLHVFSTDGNLVCRYKLDNEVPTVDISDDGSLIASISRPAIDRWDGGNDVLLLDNNCNELWKYSAIRTQDSGPTEVKLSHNNKYIAVGTFDGRVFLLDNVSKRLLWEDATNNGQVRNIQFNDDDTGVYFGSDPNLFYYNINGELIWGANIGAWPYSMAQSSKYIFVGVKVGRFLSLIDKATGQILWRYPIDARPDSMLISPDETYLIYQSSNGGLAIKNAFFDVSGNLLFNLQGANAGAITGDSGYIAFYNGNSVKLVNRRGNQLWQYQLDPEKWPAPRGGVFISNDKTIIIVADAVNGNVYFFRGGINL